jgi:Ca2+-binding RTX toxin-like protein
MLEHLETRTLLTASLANSVLTVLGTGSSDDIHISNTSANVFVKVGSEATQSFDITKVKQIVVNAGGGNDHVIVGLTNTTLTTKINGNSGNDTLQGGPGKDTLSGGDGNDSLVGNAGDDLLDGGAGTDQLEGLSGNDTLTGGEGNDAVHGGSGNDDVRGDNGNDVVIGGSGDDTLRGGDGADTLNGSTGNDIALTDSADTVKNVGTVDLANSFVPMELAEAGLTVTVDVSTNNPRATLTFSKVPDGAKFDVRWTRRKGANFMIAADIERNTENIGAKTSSKSVSFNFGRQPPGTYNVEVWSASGKSKLVQAFTTTQF